MTQPSLAALSETEGTDCAMSERESEIIAGPNFALLQP